MMLISKLRSLWSGISEQTKRFIGVRLMYVVIGLFVAHLVWIDKEEMVIVQQERDTYRDSLVIERYKIQALKQILINDIKQDEKDSLALRGLSLDSLLDYSATLQVVAGSNK